MAGESLTPTPQISLVPENHQVKDLHLTLCLIGPRKCTWQMARRPKSVERVKQGAENDISVAYALIHDNRLQFQHFDRVAAPECEV